MLFAIPAHLFEQSLTDSFLITFHTRYSSWKSKLAAQLFPASMRQMGTVHEHTHLRQTIRGGTVADGPDHFAHVAVWVTFDPLQYVFLIGGLIATKIFAPSMLGRSVRICFP